MMIERLTCLLQVRTLLDRFTGPRGKEISESSSERSSVLKVGKSPGTRYCITGRLRLCKVAKPPANVKTKIRLAFL